MDILSLPKIELHCHLDGSLPPEFISRTKNGTVSTSVITNSIANFITRRKI